MDMAGMIPLPVRLAQRGLTLRGASMNPRAVSRTCADQWRRQCVLPKRERPRS